MTSFGPKSAPNGWFNKGYVQMTAIDAATGIVLPTGLNANGVPITITPNGAVIQAEAQDIRWRDDGIAPTATVGMLLPKLNDMVYVGDLKKLQLISATAGAIANISYYDF